MVKRFYSNRYLSEFYLEWLAQHKYEETKKMHEANLLILKTQGLYNTIKKHDQKKTKAIAGFPYSFQLAAKNTFWLNLLRFYGEEKASNISPPTVLISSGSAVDTLEKWLENGEMVILKNNKQKRRGLKILRKAEDLNNTDLSDFVVGQKIIKNTDRIEGLRYNIRLFVKISNKDGSPQFSMFPEGKIIYTKNASQYITSAENHSENLPLLSNSEKLQEKRPFFAKATQQIEAAVMAHLRYFGMLLKAHVAYYDLFGVDVIFTESGHPYVLEFNRSPSTHYTNSLDKDFKERVVQWFMNDIE